MTIYRQELAIKLLVLVVSIYAHVHSISPSLTSHFVFIVSIPSIDSVIRSKRRDFFHASLITQFTSPLVCQSMLQKLITLQILCGGLLRQVASRSAAPSVSFLPLFDLELTLVLLVALVPERFGGISWGHPENLLHTLVLTAGNSS